MRKCGQDECDADAAFLYTWPGRPQSGICVRHALKLAAVARAIGLDLELIPVVEAIEVARLVDEAEREAE